MVTVGERIQYEETVEYIRSQINLSIGEMAAFVEEVVQTNYLEASFEVPMKFADMFEQASEAREGFQKYILLFPEIEEMVKESEHVADSLGVRFSRWKDGIGQAPETISVKEAMAKHQRSRSTIYRWIKNGRLNAFKQGRLWCIIAES